MSVTKPVAVFVVLFFVVLVFPPFVTARDEGSVYIRADGTVDGTDKILRDENVYTFSGDITDCQVFVEKDDIVVDGAGYTLIGAAGRGIVLSERNNVTVKNMNIEMEGGYGIYLVDTSNSMIFGNIVTGEAPNINLWRSFNNTIEGNTIMNAFAGISIYDSDNNYITGNLVTDGVVGIEFHDCANNVLRNNEMRNNRANFEVRAYPTYRVVNDVDPSNTIDGAAIYYWVEEENRTIPSDAGCVVLVDCTRITVRNLDLSQEGWQGIQLFSTTNSTLTQNTVIGSGGRGIELVNSSNINIIENDVQNFSMGINLQESSNNLIKKIQ